MKIREVMQTSVPFVEHDLPVKDLVKLIFTTNIPGFPVVKGKKLVGFITEEDVFFKIFDKANRGHKKESPAKVLEMKVSDLMIKDVRAVSPNIDLVDAQVMMYRDNFTRLPVVDSDGNLIGAVTRADIYKHIFEEEIPKLEEGQYASFIIENYDQMVEWDKRFEFEFPTLLRLFNRGNAKDILELAGWTGEYSIGLAKEGFNVTGVDDNPVMVKFANNKKGKLPAELKKKLSFEVSDYTDLEKHFKGHTFDAAICMGGSLPYMHGDPLVILKETKKVLKKNGILVLQLINLERVVEDKGRFYYFRIKKSTNPGDKEELYIEFFDKVNEKTLNHNVIRFTSDGERWIYKGVNSIEIKYLKNAGIQSMLERAGFKNIAITGNKGEYRGEYGQMSLVKPFDSRISEWMTVIATV